MMLCDFDLAHTSVEVAEIAEARHQDEIGENVTVATRTSSDRTLA